ncbi:MAG TPA: hypothetical protein VHK01_07495, partial [Lacipirellulaceae bacterium]|nr:hypothetical protein [Lacipirellulaceae bacterium]
MDNPNSKRSEVNDPPNQNKGGQTTDIRHSSFGIRHSDLLKRHPWLTFLLPFLVYMAVGMFEPAPPHETGIEVDNWFGLR